jgi:hypothetical protein
VGVDNAKLIKIQGEVKERRQSLKFSTVQEIMTPGSLDELQMVTAKLV